MWRDTIITNMIGNRDGCTTDWLERYLHQKNTNKKLWIIVNKKHRQVAKSKRIITTDNSRPNRTPSPPERQNLFSKKK